MEPTANSPCADQQQNNQLIPHASSRHYRFSGKIHTNKFHPHLKSIHNITKINYRDIFKSFDESESKSFSVVPDLLYSPEDFPVVKERLFRAEILDNYNYFEPSDEEIRIDIHRESENAAAADHHYQYLTHEAWAKHISQLKQSKLDNSSSSIMGETTLALCGQALGAVVANALSANNKHNSSSSSSWALCFVEFAVVLGLSFTLAGISLRGKQRRSSLSSVLLTKVGAAATASATIISLALQLPPPMSWTFGLSAFVIVAVAVVLA